MMLQWEWINGRVGESQPDDWFSVFRAKVPGGWLIVPQGARLGAFTFIPDPDHVWGREGEAPRKRIPYTMDGHNRCQEMRGTRSQCYLPVGHNIPCDFVALPDPT